MACVTIIRYLNDVLWTDGTFTVTYPSGTGIEDIADTGHKLAVRALQAIFEMSEDTFSVELGVGSATVTYLGDTPVPPRTALVVELALLDEEEVATGVFLSADVITETGTSRALTQADNNKILDFTSASSITVTIPAGLALPYVVGLSQGGDGQVTVDATGVTVGEIDGNLSTGGQYAMMTLMAFDEDEYRLFGRTA
jgi:hypothetical protein